MTDPIKAKIQELVPDMKWYGTVQHKITLAVVLRATLKAGKYLAVGNTGQFMDASVYIYEALCWNLEQDNYDWHVANRPETVAFIGQLLGINN